jgi:hypothetical protein
MLYREIIAVCSQIHTKPKHILHTNNIHPLTVPKTFHRLPFFGVQFKVHGTLRTPRSYIGGSGGIAPLILNL